ncbi:hypothetical protein FRB99_008217 [Tulasnella sp. 403]|nr:hypothetical protein FRB99_008217 [Tulasnella sp. 403]
MAFIFSSRGESTSKITTKDSPGGSVTAILKSKWYGKARNMPPPISTSIPQPSSGTATAPPTSALAQDLARATLLSPTFATNRDRLASPTSAPPEKRRSSPISSSSPRSPSRTDVMTLTLAARLEELELSNAEGLLDDEGYRILRQNLFASFKSPGASGPQTEQTPVRISSSGSKDSRNLRPLGDSNFHVSTMKADSIRSNNSRSTVSAVKNILRRRTSKSRTSISNETDSPTKDNNSIYSSVSRGSNSLRHHQTLASSKSSGSLGSEYSQSQQDLHSLYSRRTGVSGLTGGSRTTSRSTRGPPSSYNLRRSAPDTDDDDAHKQSSSELRTEIALVEAEYKRILDNYHGAETAAMAKLPNQMKPSKSSRPLSAVSQATVTELSWAMFPPVDDSSGSKEAENYPGNNVSVAHSTPVRPHKVSPFNRFGSLRRKPSMSSTHSSPSGSSLRPSSAASPRPSIPLLGRKASAIHLSRPNSPATLAKSTPNLMFQASPLPKGRTSNVSAKDRPGSPLIIDDSDEDSKDPAERMHRQTQKQIERIRQSREDATRRYDGRLEYLRTKLKSAELHERLLKK